MDLTFLALAGIAGTSFTLALSGAMMPGPLLTVTVAEAARRGVRAGPLVITGHALLELFLVIAVVKGMGPVLKAAPVIGTISLVGGVILLAMGVDMVRRAPAMSLSSETGRDSTGNYGHPLVFGIVGSLANPYWILWWVTIGLGYLATAEELGLPGLAAFFLGHIAADYGWYVLVAIGVARGKNVLPERGYRMMIRGCGIFLVCFGLWFFSAAFEHFGA